MSTNDRAQGTMTQSVAVSRLKELLFDNEAQALEELQKRIATVAETDAKARDEISQKLNEVFDRAGTHERFTVSVAETLDIAMRKAEISRHTELANSIAPLVVTTIKAELRNSQDEMVEALYPITGRLVKSYVASAIKDLTDQMNRRLEQNAVMLRLQSLTTGRSVAELALAGSQDFQIKDLYLIRRGTGELIAHWPETGDSNRDQVMSGVLAAVNEFANEAFAADQSTLRQISFGTEEVYLRGSPLYLLAARCSGTAHKSIEQTLDDAFLRAVEAQHQIDVETAGWQDGPIRKSQALALLGSELNQLIDSRKSEIDGPVRRGALKTLAALILIPLLSWLTWSWYSTYEEGKVRSTAVRVFAATAEMQGYPSNLNVGPRGTELTVSGLAPSEAAKTKIIGRLSKVLPGTEIHDRLTVVAGSNISIPDVSPQIEKLDSKLSTLETGIEALMARRSIERAELRLTQAEGDLNRAAADEPKLSEGLKSSASKVRNYLTELRQGLQAMGEAEKTRLDIAASYDGLATKIAEESDAITSLISSAPRPAKVANALGEPPSLAFAAERLASEAEHLATVASTFALAKSLRPNPAPAPVVQVTPRERLQQFVRAKAVFFGNNTEYRDPQATMQTLRELAPLIKAAGVLVRVVGYTDEVGNIRRNLPLAQGRAEKVRQDLMSFGAPVSLLTSIGRADVLDLSAIVGADSPNRRVEFEVGFDGENLP